MKLRNSPLLKTSFSLLLALCVNFASAGTLSINDQPLATGTGNAVKPNLIFILDDSGSMSSDYTPDWVSSSICQTNMGSFGSTDDCNFGSPPYMSGEFNKQYYSPKIRYNPPKDVNSPYDVAGTNWDGTTRPAGERPKSNPTSATTTPYPTASGTKNLTTTYTDTYWCKNSTDDISTCRTNDGTHYGYGYPNSLFDSSKTKNGAPYYYVISGSPTWCSDDNLTTCQTRRTSTYQYPRFSDVVTATAGTTAVPEQPAVAASLTITVTQADSSKSITALKCGATSAGATSITSGVPYNTTGSSGSARRRNLASWLSTKLSGCSNPASGGWSVNYSSGNEYLTISWPVTGTVGNGQKFFIDLVRASGITVDAGGVSIVRTSMPGTLDSGTFGGGSNFVAGSAGSPDVVTYPSSGVQFAKVMIDPSVTSYTKYSKRTDCAGASTCTYAEELQNFANWYTYYRKRILMMQSAVSRVFYDITDTKPGVGFRVGFDVISNSASSLSQDVGSFSSTQRSTFYTQLFTASPGSYTPLRGALSKAGRAYAGSITPDPVQYSCQQNFTFLSTDGYWNTNDETTGYGPFKDDGSSNVGDQDGSGAAAAAASVTIHVTNVNNPSTVSAVSCGTTSSGTSVFSGSSVYNWSGGASRRQALAAWLAGKLASCPQPAAGPWTISYTSGSENITISWPSTGTSGNGEKFYLGLAATAGVSVDIAGASVVATSMPASLPFGSLSSGADAVAAPSRPYLDTANASNTLADVAMYYYNHDLRSSMADDITPSTRDPATYQHMVTYTMGLGVDGLVQYDKDYDSGGSADYNAIVDGTMNWTNPITNTTDARIDDLWHAAVNGRGKYFSASDPDAVQTQFNEAIAIIAGITGAAAAAATSNLQPTNGDNYAFTASYQTQVWNGDIQARSIDLITGELSVNPLWSSAYQLSKQSSRTLYSFDGSLSGEDKKRSLIWSNVKSSAPNEQAYFAVTNLSQCTPATSCPGATSENLFDYLMGGADATTNKSYRTRSPASDPSNAAVTVPNILGDIVNSQPVYVSNPNRAFTDTGYADYKGTYQTTPRGKTVYVGANDGFLHAFNAETGDERWAYMPSVLLSSIYNLADTGYDHKFYADGVIAENDVYDGTNWRTVLVAGLNKGGNYYYALDVTNPTAPKALWEFTDSKMGYSYGNPIITKLPAGATNSSGTDIAGSWVALVTSGYNNGAGGNGQGVLYALDVVTGTELFRIETNSTSASAASPIGLAKINAWANDPVTNDTALYVYGGDLNGDLWRFDLANKSVFNIAAVGEPITVKPELGEISGQRVLFFGTGLFLQKTDAANTAQRTIFAIKDDPAATVALSNVKTSGALVQQTLVTLSGTTRTVDSGAEGAPVNPVDWSTKSGWFVNLPDAGERVNVDPKLVLGSLIVASNVPDASSSNSCQAGGYGWLNVLDMTTGGYVSTSQVNTTHVEGWKLTGALAVGVNVVKLPSGAVKAIVTTSDNKHPVLDVPIGSTATDAVRRISWRELLVE